MLQLYAPTTKSGIIDKIYSDLGITVDDFPLADITREINLAKTNLLTIALKANGWIFDDSNHTDYPIIKTNIVSGQRDYSFTTDENGYFILDIYRVMVCGEDGIYYDLELTDQKLKGGAMGMVNGQELTGKPSKYNKLGNGIFLDAIPDYNYTSGIKIFINRESTQFSTPTVNVADTTKSGFDARLDEYLCVRPEAYYANLHNLKSLTFLNNELLKYEGDEDRGITGKIESIYSKRDKDVPTQIITKYRSSR